MRSKTYQTIKEKIPAEKVTVEMAANLIKKHARQSFDETIELHVRLGVNPAKSDQMVRGSVALPAGAVKQQHVVVFTDDPAQQEAAKQAGAINAGGQELITAIENSGTLDADNTVATPDIMPKVARVAKILGPKGLMPNPKTGTVSDDPAAVVKELLGGKLSYKMDQLGNVHIAVAKVSWDTKKITQNVEATLASIRDAKPATAKGEFMKTIVLKSTMGPAIKMAA